MDILSWEEFHALLPDEVELIFQGAAIIAETSDETISALVYDYPDDQPEQLPHHIVEIVKSDRRNWFYIDDTLYSIKISDECVLLQEFNSSDYVAAWLIMDSVEESIKKVKSLYASRIYQNRRSYYSN